MNEPPLQSPGERVAVATATVAPTASVTVGNARRGLGAMVIATVLVTLFNSEGLTVYARDLPGNAFSDAVVALADDWHDVMLDIGLTQVSESVRDVFLSFKETQW